MPFAGRGSVAGWVRFGVPGLLLGALLSPLTGARGPSALAQGYPSGAPAPPLTSAAQAADRPRGAAATAAAESSGTIALTSPAGGNAQLLYLIDTKSRAFAVYRVDPSSPKGAVKLEAARQYLWDLKLTEYNNQAPEVASIESTVNSRLGAPAR